MRTTVDLDDDVLAAAKELARARRTSLGRELSQLARQALAGGVSRVRGTRARVAGFRPFAPRGEVVTNEAVEGVRDEEGV